MSFESILIWTFAIAAALGSAMLVVALRGSAASEIAVATAAGHFAAALDAARHHPPEQRDDLLAAAIAAKHRASFEEAAGWLGSLLASDPTDGEALLELGLVETYDGRPDQGDARLREAAAQRADLGESITLHRAFAALVSGDVVRGRRQFEEVEASLETKLTLDVGSGEPAFAEWFLHTAALWRAGGQRERAAWAWGKAEESAPESLLPRHVETLLASLESGAP